MLDHMGNRKRKLWKGKGKAMLYKNWKCSLILQLLFYSQNITSIEAFSKVKISEKDIIWEKSKKKVNFHKQC